MNEERELIERSVIDLLMEAGTPGLVSFWTTLFFIVVGSYGIKMKFSPSSCRAYMLLAALPVVVGFYGASHLLIAFRTEAGHFQGENENLARFFYSGEVMLPLAVGCFGSSVLMFFASILWVRSKEETSEG